jgi:hypothetical protein
LKIPLRLRVSLSIKASTRSVGRRGREEDDEEGLFRVRRRGRRASRRGVGMSEEMAWEWT